MFGNSHRDGIARNSVSHEGCQKVAVARYRFVDGGNSTHKFRDPAGKRESDGI